MIDSQDPYMELASIIVTQNIHDYIYHATQYQIYHINKHLYEMQGIKRFFYSDRFKLYCNIHPDHIMDYIEKEIKKNVDKYRTKDQGT